MTGMGRSKRDRLRRVNYFRRRIASALSADTMRMLAGEIFNA
jgi:hypothetical protein